MKVKRVGPTNSRVTEGKIYQLNEVTMKIVDDGGSDLRPAIDCKDYWEVLESDPTNCDVTTERSEMLKIEKRVYVNGKNNDSIGIDEVIALIEHEDHLMNRLVGLNLQSKAVDKMIEKHKHNKVELTKLLNQKLEDKLEESA